MRTNLLSEASRAWIYTPADAGQEIEVIHWQYYSFTTVLGNQDGTTCVMPSILSFFNATAGMPTSTGVLTKQDTNIPKPNAVGSPYKFLIQEVFPIIFPVAATPASETAAKKQMDDVIQILKSGVVSLNVLGVSRMEVAPLLVLGSGCGLAGGALVSQAFSNGAPLASNRYNVEIGLHKDTSFELTASFPTTFPVYNNIRIGMVMDGLLQRPKGK